MKSFKDWPILWKLLAIGVGTILVCNALWYLGEGYFVGSSDQAQEIRSATNRVSIEMLEARRAEKDFLLRDLDDAEFYQRGDTVHLQKHRKALAALLREVDTLSRLGAETSPTDENAHQQLRGLVDQYAKAFGELVIAYRERGFFNWGLEGKWREAIHRVEAKAQSLKLQKAVLQLRRDEKDYLMRRLDKYIQAVYADLKGLETLVQEEKGVDTAGLLADLKEYKQAFEAYLAQMQKIGLTEEQGLTGEMRKSIHALEPVVERVRERAVQASEEARRRLTFARLGVLGFSVALGAVLFFFLGRAVSRPITESVTRLSSASAEILASTSQQAAGAEEQAAAVSETVATVTEVTQTAEQAAQRAKAVGEAVQNTVEIGRSGRKAVEDAIAALDTVKEQVESTGENILALAEQAQAISQIISSVNDIAEQTNLLALNAAIEASRAGEHGKGFSVVAAEVKSLADQSKKATAQVRQILGEIQKATNVAVLSTEGVTKGVVAATKVADQAGATIQTLTETLDESAQTAVQIVASAGQQAAGMAQVFQAMKNIDEVAKQNLAALQQSEQAAKDLNALGAQLAGLVGK